VLEEQKEDDEDKAEEQKCEVNFDPGSKDDDLQAKDILEDETRGESPIKGSDREDGPVYPSTSQCPSAELAVIKSEGSSNSLINEMAKAAIRRTATVNF